MAIGSIKHTHTYTHTTHTTHRQLETPDTYTVVIIMWLDRYKLSEIYVFSFSSSLLLLLLSLLTIDCSIRSIHLPTYFYATRLYLWIVFFFHSLYCKVNATSNAKYVWNECASFRRQSFLNDCKGIDNQPYSCIRPLIQHL